MGKKLWLFMQPRNFSSDKIVRRYVHPPLHNISWGDILHFRQPACFGGKLHGHRDFKREKNNNKAKSFFGLNFSVYVVIQFLSFF